MQVDFYSLIENQPDRSVDLRTNLVTLLDKLLDDDTISASDSSKIASLRAKIVIDLADLT